MTDSPESPEDNRASINLKLPQATVSLIDPWNDDALNRSQLAETLTNLLRTQSNPFSLSIHGYWGTGKTFLLQRWQRDLQTQGFEALYFNAWEDDFCDDPLLAILGQLQDHFKDSGFSRLARAAIGIAGPLLRQTAQTLVTATTGLSIDLQQNGNATLLDQYLDQRRTKDDLKEHLASLAEAVYDETSYPLVFIIDELDRCRPTFAIELLERVKHIFDIKHMVFVFGINRSELCTSLCSIYGEIDSDVYLRRFFDIEFTLPEIDSSVYCKHVMDKFGLQSYFSNLSSEANNRVHAVDYDNLYEICPELWSHFGFSLRDIDRCAALIAIVAKNVHAGHDLYPAVLSLLIPMKLKNPDLYDGFVRGQRRASEVIDYADSIRLAKGVSSRRALTVDPIEWIEAHLYVAENAENVTFLDLERSESAIGQLRLLGDDKELSSPEYLSERIKSADRNNIFGMLTMIDTAMSRYQSHRDIIKNAASLIDLYQDILRK